MSELQFAQSGLHYDVPRESRLQSEVDVWTEHFEWDDYTLVGKTEVGRVTIQALDLNHERRIKIRQAEQLLGLFPPDSVVR